MIPFPNKKYQIIYADPPWSYNDKMKGTGLEIEKHYPTMSVEDICNLPIKNIADNDCLLFIWAVNAMLPEALQVIKSWGFKYKTVGFVWNKLNHRGNLVYNLGRYTMSNCELCLIARKGTPKRITKNIKQLIIDIRSEHSKKPREARRRIVKLMGDLPRIELFARPPKDRLFEDDSYKGWDVWGNEV